MDDMPVSGFRWFSPLGISVLLFMFSGIFRIIIGVMTPVLINTKIGTPMIIMSPRADREYFREDPEKILHENNQAKKIRTLVLTLLAGLLITSGILTVSLAWFALRSGQVWSLLTLIIAGICEAPLWFLFFRYYTQAGVHLSLADIPPFIWVPELLMIPAATLAMIFFLNQGK